MCAHIHKHANKQTNKQVISFTRIHKFSKAGMASFQSQVFASFRYVLVSQQQTAEKKKEKEKRISYR
jgi:hypothetical protein